MYHGGSYGALGLSRRKDLMYKPLVHKVTPLLLPILISRLSVPDFVSKLGKKSPKLRDKIQNGKPGFEATFAVLMWTKAYNLPVEHELEVYRTLLIRVHSHRTVPHNSYLL